MSSRRFVLFCHAAVAIALGILPSLHADDWPVWRGPEGNNHAADETRVPEDWDLTGERNVLWKTKIPGRGHSTPIVVQDAIYMTTSSEQDQTQSLLKLDRQNGRLLDQWVIHRGGLPDRIHAKNSHASPTPSHDGEHIIVAFHQDDAIVVTAMTTNGRKVWQTRVCDFRPSMFEFGYGASPLIADRLVIVAAEYDGPASGIYALDRSTGKQVWKTPRPNNLSFASPIAATIAGVRYVLLAGAGTIAGYDPVSGRERWSADAATDAICGTAVWDGRRVMVSGGNPASGTWCVAGDGSEKLLWENGVMCYEQSLLAIDDHVFAVADNGVAYCWRSMDGKEMWRARLFGGGISASPLLVGDRLVVAAEDGTVYILKATPTRFELLETNTTGDSIFASPVAVDNRLLIRTGINEGDQRQEYLVAIGLR